MAYAIATIILALLGYSAWVTGRLMRSYNDLREWEIKATGAIRSYNQTHKELQLARETYQLRLAALENQLEVYKGYLAKVGKADMAAVLTELSEAELDAATTANADEQAGKT